MIISRPADLANWLLIKAGVINYRGDILREAFDVADIISTYVCPWKPVESLDDYQVPLDTAAIYDPHADKIFILQSVVDRKSWPDVLFILAHEAAHALQDREYLRQQSIFPGITIKYAAFTSPSKAVGIESIANRFADCLLIPEAHLTRKFAQARRELRFTFGKEFETTVARTIESEWADAKRLIQRALARELGVPLSVAERRVRAFPNQGYL